MTMDYRKMTCVQLAEESDRGSPSPPTSEQFDAIMAELARRDAMLAAAEKMAEAMEQTVRPCERCGLISVADQVRSSLSAYRAAEGGEA